MSDDTERNLPLDPSELETTGVMQETRRRDHLHSATTEILAAKEGPSPPPVTPPVMGTERVPKVSSRSVFLTLFLALAAFAAAMAITTWWLRR